MYLLGCARRLAQLQPPNLTFQSIQAVSDRGSMSLALKWHLIEETPVVSLLRVQLLPFIHRLREEGDYVCGGGVMSYDHDDIVLCVKLLKSISRLLCCWRILVESCLAGGDLEKGCLQASVSQIIKRV